jgi:hypothetical protein
MQGATQRPNNKNRMPPKPGLVKNRGGRPRKDGTLADPAKTLADHGISKRRAALARLYASVEDEDAFEAAHDECVAQTSKRMRPLTDFLPLPHRGSNCRHRETRANIARIISTARLILKAHEFDNSTEGAMMRLTAERTIELWTMLRR